MIYSFVKCIYAWIFETFLFWFTKFILCFWIFMIHIFGISLSNLQIIQFDKQKSKIILQVKNRFHTICTLRFGLFNFLSQSIDLFIRRIYFLNNLSIILFAQDVLIFTILQLNHSLTVLAFHFIYISLEFSKDESRKFILIALNVTNSFQYDLFHFKPTWIHLFEI